MTLNICHLTKHVDHVDHVDNAAAGEDDVTDVTKAVACILRAISTLPQTRGTLIQVIDAWKKIDKPGAKDLGREGAEQVCVHVRCTGMCGCY